MASKSHTTMPVAAIASLLMALAIGSAPVAALIALSAKLGGVQ
jgi:H+/gluconate symporter-like permease